MSGNVWEWTWDWYGAYSGDVIDPTGPSSGPDRVIRGGSWDDDARDVRVANRGYAAPGSSGSIGGFRLARTGSKLFAAKVNSIAIPPCPVLASLLSLVRGHEL